MNIYAKDVMVETFDKVHHGAPVANAITRILNGKVRASGHKTVSLIVIDDLGNLAGVISMYDILYHLRPDFLNMSVDAGVLAWEGQMLQLVETLKGKKVRQLMSRNVTSASLDDHIMVVLDKMIKNKFRRLPVVDRSKPIGVIYFSEIYHTIFSKLPV